MLCMTRPCSDPGKFTMEFEIVDTNLGKISLWFRAPVHVQCMFVIHSSCILIMSSLLSQTCTSVHDGPPRVKEARGIALTSPARPSEGMGQIRPPRMTHAKTLDKHLPIQEKPSLKPDTQSHSQVTHMTSLSTPRSIPPPPRNP